MGKSRYVLEAQGPQGENLLYNVANGAFVELGPEAWEAWSADACEGTLASRLGDLGFLTGGTPAEELEFQRVQFDRMRADTSRLTFSFIPTYACNFRCPYCYELGHNQIKGKMGGRIMDAIMSFVEFKYARDRFEVLSVQWYGGDPSLALEEVAELSSRLIAWADGHGVAYEAMMLTNANVIGEAEAQLIANCRVSTVFLTIDGPEEVHNKRRIAANGSNSYRKTIEAARLFRSHGMRLLANMNTDKTNIVTYEGLRKKLLEEEGIELTTGKLNDYGHFYGEPPFCKPDFDLFTHEDYFRAQFEEFAKRSHEPAELREMFRPIDRFCTGQLDNYFIVDLLGDVYACDGRVGDKEYVKFNILDDPSTWKLHEITFDAPRDEKCGSCELLPLCQGNCIWERVCCGMPCHPFRTTGGDYLRVYRESIGDVAIGKDGLSVLAEPFSPAELGWR